MPFVRFGAIRRAWVINGFIVLFGIGHEKNVREINLSRMVSHHMPAALRRASLAQGHSPRKGPRYSKHSQTPAAGHEQAGSASASNGCPTWIRTRTRRVKVACATITPSGSDGGPKEAPRPSRVKGGNDHSANPATCSKFRSIPSLEAGAGKCHKAHYATPYPMLSPYIPFA